MTADPEFFEKYPTLESYILASPVAPHIIEEFLQEESQRLPSRYGVTSFAGFLQEMKVNS